MIFGIIKIQYRIIVDLLLLGLIFILPWWLSLVLIIAGVFLFKYFFESLVFALLMDGFFGIPDGTLWGSNIVYTVIIGTILIISIFLKTRLRFY